MYETTISVCTDCMIAAVNDDYEGMSDAREHEVRAGLERVGWLGYIEDQGFSWRPCGCCGSRLAGDRFKMSLLNEMFIGQFPWRNMSSEATTNHLG